MGKFNGTYDKGRIYNKQILVYVTPQLRDKLSEVGKSFRMTKQFLYRDLLYWGLSNRYGVEIDPDEEKAAVEEPKEELKSTETDKTEE